MELQHHLPLLQQTSTVINVSIWFSLTVQMTRLLYFLAMATEASGPVLASPLAVNRNASPSEILIMTGKSMWRLRTESPERCECCRGMAKAALGRPFAGPIWAAAAGSLLPILITTASLISPLRNQAGIA